MYRLLIWICCVLIAWFSPKAIHAQKGQIDILNKVQEANSGKVISYNYTVYQINTANNIIEDSVKGNLYKDGLNYLDSSNSSLSARNNRYYWKVDFRDKELTVYDIDLLQKKTGMEFTDEPVPVVGLPDSTILAHAKIDVIKTSDKFFSIKVSFKEQGGSHVVLDMEANTFIVRSMTMETVSRDATYRQVYKINNISHTVPSSIFQMQRFFAVNGDKVAPAVKYAAYKLNTLTN